MWAHWVLATSDEDARGRAVHKQSVILGKVPDGSE
jgi:hypothetical protein